MMNYKWIIFFLILFLQQFFQKIVICNYQIHSILYIGHSYIPCWYFYWYILGNQVKIFGAAFSFPSLSKTGLVKLWNIWIKSLVEGLELKKDLNEAVLKCNPTTTFPFVCPRRDSHLLSNSISLSVFGDAVRARSLWFRPVSWRRIGKVYL